MQPKKYLAWMIVGAVVTTLFLFSSLIISLGTHLEEGRWVNECLQKKSVAVAQHNPKLIILSGSNSLFGFSAKRLSENYGVPSVNMATHAGLGANYIFYYGRRFIAPGRIFVLPLEYELYDRPSSAGAFIYQVVGFDTQYFWTMPLIQKAQFAFGISWDDRLRFLKNTFSLSVKNETGGYQSRTLNAWGDETMNAIENRTLAMVAGVNASPQSKVFSIDENVWNELSLFVKEVNAAGGQVVLTYPNIYAKYLNMEMNKTFFSELKTRANKLGVKLLGNPDAARFDESLLFDTRYHQNTLGQTKATDRLYDDLHRAGII